MKRGNRRARRITGQQRATALLLQALAEHVMDGSARAGLEIQMVTQGEIWRVEARINRRGDRVIEERAP